MQNKIRIRLTKVTLQSHPALFVPSEFRDSFHSPSHLFIHFQALVQFRTGPMADGIKCVRLCALFCKASARCETALAARLQASFIISYSFVKNKINSNSKLTLVKKSKEQFHFSESSWSSSSWLPPDWRTYTGIPNSVQPTTTTCTRLQPTGNTQSHSQRRFKFMIHFIITHSYYLLN